MAVKSRDLSSAITCVSMPAGLRPTRIIKGDLILRSFNIWGPLSQMRPHSQVLGIGIQTYFLGGQYSTLCPFYVPRLWLVTCTQGFYDFCMAVVRSNQLALHSPVAEATQSRPGAVCLSRGWCSVLRNEHPWYFQLCSQLAGVLLISHPGCASGGHREGRMLHLSLMTEKWGHVSSTC